LVQPAPVGIITEFCEVLKGVHGNPHLAEDESEAVRVIRGIIAETGATKVAVAGLPPNLESLVRKALDGTTFHFLRDLVKNEALKVLAKCDCGITWADFAVARQGALVEIVYDDATKLTSSLPFTHIALVASTHMLPDLTTAMTKVGSIVQSSPQGRKPTVSFIGGPSKTGDIEMRLLYGVHGPNDLHVVLLDWVK
jgi:L-lactate dehydrogenase complex protein LldG